MACAFVLTGSFLFVSRYTRKGERDLSQITWKTALVIGLVQGLAITPGISRSGSTIVVALFLGLKRDLAARYSFLLSVPAIGGAFLLKSGDISVEATSLFPMVLGVLAAILSGYVALRWLIRLVNAGDFFNFCWYVWAVAIFSFWLA